MLTIALSSVFNKMITYYHAFKIRLEYGHSTLVAARLAYLEVN